VQEELIFMTESVKSRFVFTYESDAAASYLIVTADDVTKVWNYQIEMIASNRIKRILSFDTRLKNDRVGFYYNVTSKLPLQQFLKKKKIKRNDFINILLEITNALLDCRYYLLNERCFVIDERYIYINPATLEISMVYIPVPVNADINLKVREFVIGLIVYTADLEENSGDDFVQKILTHVKSDTFGILALNNLLKELAGSRGLFDTDTGGPSQSSGNELPAIPPLKEDKVNKGKDKCNTAKNVRYRPVLIALLCQVLIVAALIFGNRYIKSLGKDTTTTYAAIAMIIAAVDVLLLRKLFGGKDSGIPKKEAIKGISSIPRTKVSLDNRKEKDSCQPGIEVNAAKSHISGSLSGSSDSNMNETVFLGRADDKYPYLLGEKGGMPEIISVAKTDFVIGRLQGQADYISRNKAVGKVHAKIISRDGSYYVVDYNSRNGTFINDARINCNTEYEIRNNDRVSFATSEYTFVIPSERKVSQ